MPFTHDIIIVGSGIIGSSLACAIAKRTSLTIGLLDAKAHAPSWSVTGYHHRVSAITLSSQRFLNSLNLWTPIKEKRISPFTHIEVWEDQNTKLEFNSADIAEPCLGFIIENNLIQSVLMDQIKTFDRINYIAPAQLTRLEQNHDGITLHTSDQQLKAPLVIAADGMHSWIRQQAGIEIKCKDYHQEAIVANVITQHPHHKIARQIFLKTGPLAFLPLLEANTSSIVWTLPKELAQEYMALAEEEFKQKLKDAFSFAVGEIVEITKRYQFPLTQQQTKQYVAPHLALVGDAAHTVHPLAGQGVNMGFRDVARLTDIIVNAINRHKHYADLSPLRAYERQSKAENFPYFCAIDGLHTLFAKGNQMPASLRSLGMKAFNKIDIIKNLCMRFATGKDF